MSTQQRIHLISGLGADEKVFSNLDLQGYTTSYVPWLTPHKKERITAYAARMAEQINDPAPVILGVSFGGMMGIEISKLLPVQKLFIVSSIKTVRELPRWMRVVGAMQLNKFLPTKSYKYTEKVDNNRLGVSTAEEKEMVRAYRRNANPVYVEWAINEVLNWKNDWHPETIVHIHGDNDRIFPVKKIGDAHVLKGGTHMMIYNRASEIASIVRTSLQTM